jgi:hypothetical protein
MEAPLGVWGFIPSHFPLLLGFLLAQNLGSPYLGRKLKARIVTIRARSLARNILGVEGHVEALRWGVRKVTSKSITHTDLYKPINKLVNA